MIEIIRPGLYTTIQDAGRFGYRLMGVPVSGPMDRRSAQLANKRLGNDPNAPLIEMAFVGASFLFHSSAYFSFAGARPEVTIDNQSVELRSVMHIEAGSVLSFGKMRYGNFLYFAILGGLLSENVLGSSCYYQSVNDKDRMKKGDILHFDETSQSGAKLKKITFPIPTRFRGQLLVEKGPEFNLLSDEDIVQLTNTEFSISPQSNRMGFRITERVNIASKEIISSPVQPGTIQLTAGGQLLVLMRDAQTTGGFPRILQLTEESINQLAQFPIGKPFYFTIVDL